MPEDHSAQLAGLLEGLLLALHLPVVVQQVALAGAVEAVAGVEAPRLVRMLNQHDVLLARGCRAGCGRSRGSALLWSCPFGRWLRC